MAIEQTYQTAKQRSEQNLCLLKLSVIAKLGPAIQRLVWIVRSSRTMTQGGADLSDTTTPSVIARLDRAIQYSVLIAEFAGQPGRTIFKPTEEKGASQRTHNSPSSNPLRTPLSI